MPAKTTLPTATAPIGKPAIAPTEAPFFCDARASNRQSRTTAAGRDNMTKRLDLIFNGKGGVGKSVLRRQFSLGFALSIMTAGREKKTGLSSQPVKHLDVVGIMCLTGAKATVFPVKKEARHEQAAGLREFRSGGVRKRTGRHRHTDYD
jgi:hypothetical protein